MNTILTSSISYNKVPGKIWELAKRNQVKI